MPELPEVETIKRGLESKIIGLVIKKVEVLNPKSFHGDPDQLVGSTITHLWRRAKLLGIDLSNGQTLLFHLKMSGQLILQGESRKGKGYRPVTGGHPTKDMLGPMPNKSTRVIFELTDSSYTLNPNPFTLYFNDQRKFGWIKVFPTIETHNFEFIQKLGPEPLDQEFTPQILQQILSKHPKLPIKVAILDQSAIAGIGNIYASEACFLAGIHPQTPAGKLTVQNFNKLHRGIIDSLESSIKYGGSSRHTYVNESGEKGYFLEVANVYDRQGLPCRNCSTIIQKITLAGRGTYFCATCQPTV